MGELYSHPGKLLRDHLFNVYRLGMAKFDSKKINFKNLAEVQLLTRIVLLTHDFGKANKYFQRKLHLSSEGLTECAEYQELTKQGKNKSNHSLLSAIFTYYILDELIDNDLLTLLGMIVVYRHHGNLKDFKDMVMISDEDWDLLEKQFKATNLEGLQEILDLIDLEIDIRELQFSDFKDKIDNYKFRRKVRKLDLPLVENYLILNLIYSILISSDKAEAIFYSKGLSYDRLEDLVLSRRGINPKAVDRYKQIKGWDQPKTKMDQKRNQIYNEIIEQIEESDLEDRILSINVPTGTGKTLSSLAAGLRLREKVGQNHRLIYTLPFTSIIDQNYEVFTDVFEKTGAEVDSSLIIKHHYLTPKSYIREEDYEDEEYDVSKHLIESWNSEIIVTTFVQLLHSIFANQNRSLLKFYNLSNSIILLDEVQSIPHKYWQLTKVILKEIADKLDCYFIFITATMPLIYSEARKEIKELACSKEEYFKFFDRIKLDLSEFRAEKSLDEFKEFISDELEEYQDKNFLIILNTIKTSIAVYDYISQALEEGWIEGESIYLATNIVPKERRERIARIGNSDKRQIIVSTQMVEAGVDIDLDRVYRDFAPLDSINQTCGRCNRNFDSDKKGVVTIVKLVNENHNNKAYASYVYDETLLRTTDKLLASLSDLVEERDFFRINSDYFLEVDDIKSNDSSLDLLKKIKELKYERAFWRDEEGKEVFELIAQDFESVNLFIELDEYAKNIWEKYRRINQMEINSLEDYSKRKAQFEKIKREFLSYVVTIPKQVAIEQLEEEQLDKTFNLIDHNQVSGVYDSDTGFIRVNSQADMYF
jgi:CRISPR-associated endonuclease/helicase Cas3